MPCAVKSSFETGLQISLSRSIIETPISLLTKLGFHASNRRSLLFDFGFRALSANLRKSRKSANIFMKFYSTILYMYSTGCTYLQVPIAQGVCLPVG
jgi:hypothetical protein